MVGVSIRHTKKRARTLRSTGSEVVKQLEGICVRVIRNDYKRGGNHFSVKFRGESSSNSKNIRQRVSAEKGTTFDIGIKTMK